MANPISRIERSVRLVRASWDVLRSDGELLLLPVLSGAATVLVVGGFIGAAMASGTFDNMQAGETVQMPPAFYAGLFVMYVAQYFVIIFFNTALVGAAIARLEGRDPTVRSALKLAASRIGPIFGYAVISATVGIILRTFAERLGFIGRLVVAGIGVAWTVATFLVVPILAAEGIGPLAAIAKSGALLKKSWGENVIGNTGIALTMGVIAGVIAFVGVGGGAKLYDGGYAALGIPIMAVSAASVVTVMVVGAALSAVYQAAVYTYATSGRPPRDFDDGLVREAFAPKGT
jgi:hypothetical protein